MISLQENKLIAQKFCEETWGKGNLAILDELASSDFQINYPILSGMTLDREGFKLWILDAHRAFPDMQFAITSAIAEAEKVVISWTCRGTHLGPIKMLNLSPTGKSASWTGITIYRVVEGKIVEEQGEEDILGLFQQLGLIHY